MAWFITDFIVIDLAGCREALGLSGQVKLADFVSVLEGRLPDGGDLSRADEGRAQCPSPGVWT